MSSLGHTLRQAREAKGLTTSKVAAETRILVQIIDDIENEDFHRIAAPIYGRGFVRLFAECVGLDPQPLIREFMDLYEGRRAPTVHVRDVPAAEAAPPPAPPPLCAAVPPPEADVPSPAPSPLPPPAVERPPEPVAAPTVEPPPVVRGLDLFERPAPPPPPLAAPAPRAPEDSPFLPPGCEGGGRRAADRFRSSLSSVSHGVLQSMRGIPRSAWRKALLAAGALGVLALLVFGCVTLYRMTAAAPAQPPPADAPAPAARDSADVARKPAPPAPPAVTAKKPSVPLRSTGPKIPSLYVD